MSRANSQSRRELGRRRANARWARHVPAVDNLTADDAYYRMLEDRRGFVVGCGTTYRGGREPVTWQICYSLRGRTDQFDVVVNGTVLATGGSRLLKRKYPWTRTCL